MRVVVENLTGSLFYVQVGNEGTVADLKREIEAQQKLPYDRLILILGASDGDQTGIMMNNDEDRVSLADYGVQEGSHIYIFFNPLDDGSTHRLLVNCPDSLLRWP